MGAFFGIEYRVQPRFKELWGAGRGELFGVDSVGIDVGSVGLCYE